MKTSQPMLARMGGLYEVKVVSADSMEKRASPIVDCHSRRAVSDPDFQSAAGVSGWIESGSGWHVPSGDGDRAFWDEFFQNALIVTEAR
jgi:hypothetical protein